MAFQTGPPPTSLSSLAVELQLTIISMISAADTYSLRQISRHFYNLIPPLTHIQLLEIESSIGNGDYLACAARLRLRHTTRFNDLMRAGKRRAGKSQAYLRFCNDCGCRPLPGPYVYKRGAKWIYAGVFYLRCSRCRQCCLAPEDRGNRRCPACWSSIPETRDAKEKWDLARKEYQSLKNMGPLVGPYEAWEQRRRQALRLRGTVGSYLDVLRLASFIPPAWDHEWSDSEGVRAL